MHFSSKKQKIPTYGKDDDNANFSGKHKTRGTYRTADGCIINADLNGSANIGRKAFPDMFVGDGIIPDFSNVLVYKHPDSDAIEKNRTKQKAPNTSKPSKAKARRIAAKQKKAKSNPSGIELCE